MSRPRRTGTLVSRVVRAMVVVAVLSSIALAGTSAFISRLLWRSAEETALRETSIALGASVKEQADEDQMSYAEAAPEAVKDAAVVGYRLEVWNGTKLLWGNGAGDALGPPAPEADEFSRSGWLARTVAFPENVTLLVATPEEFGLRAFSVFLWSLILSMPFCLLLAVGVGWIVGKRVTSPLVQFTESIRHMREMSALAGAGAPTGVPSEIADLDEAFRDLWERLSLTLQREMEFAANASHEMRTPLTAIRLHAEQAQRHADAEGRIALSEQIREIDRMVRLVDSLLVMARDTKGGIHRGEVVNLADLVRDLVARLYGGAGLETTALPPEMSLPDEALVQGDENLLTIAIENLLENARKFTPGENRARVAIESDGSRVRLSVVSPGARIARADRDLLFERFYRSPEARARHAGLGLGLPLARHIARLHGGDVQCVSGPEEDARFVLELAG